MGEVYRAEDTKLKRTVALKRIAPHFRSDPHYRQRFLREAEYASRLNEPHIAGIHDVVEDGEDTFLVMEYVEGQTLRQRLSQPLPLADFLSIAQQCATALVAAHEQRVVHGDIKPENIMLTPAGQVKILDFGVAKVFPHPDETAAATTAEFRTQSGILSGTPSYMAPEVLLEKERDARADLFSLGVIFYEALTGRHPFRGQSFVDTCQQILEKTPPPIREFNPRVPAELERIVGKMLAKDPRERYASSADLLVDLRALEEPRKQLPARAAGLRAWASRRRGLLPAFAALGMIAAAIALTPAARQRVRDWLGASPVLHEKSVAVLPFTVLGADKQSTPFSDGLTEVLTTKLTQLTLDPTLQVVSAPDVRARGATTVDAARKEFGVTLALLGSLQAVGDQLQIHLSLVDTRSKQQLRTRNVTTAAADPFAVQDRVVNAVVDMLELEVQPRERQALETHGTQVAGAYDLYMQGRGYLQNYDAVQNIGSAIELFGRALQLDSNYALAYAGRGEAYWKMYERSRDPRWVESSQRDCERALSLDAGLPAAHACLGTLYNGTGRYQEATSEFERAIATEPTNDDAYRGLATAYSRLGKPAQAEAIYWRAIELRPQYWAGYNWLGAFYYGQARYDKAAEMFAQVTSLAPDNARGLRNLGTTYVALGRYADAKNVFERGITLRPSDSAFTNLGNAYFYLRRYAEATQAYEQSITYNQADPLLWRNLGDGYYWTPGKRAQAADAYRRAVTLAGEQLRVNPKDVSSLGMLAICEAMLGEKKAALDALGKGLGLAPQDPEMLFKAALVHNHLGDTPQTFIWLEKALAAGILRLRVRDTPDFDHLRSEARFQQLLGAK
jgi:tetratricopeptide (TPR) repeat protein/TolB-like protein/tRNA A-37 threonylcarbamoyl transferase component Bud32